MPLPNLLLALPTRISVTSGLRTSYYLRQKYLYKSQHTNKEASDIESVVFWSSITVFSPNKGVSSQEERVSQRSSVFGRTKGRGDWFLEESGHAAYGRGRRSVSSSRCDTGIAAAIGHGFHESGPQSFLFTACPRS